MFSFLITLRVRANLRASRLIQEKKPLRLLVGDATKAGTKPYTLFCGAMRWTSLPYKLVSHSAIR